jgi:hypothetical protein
MSVSDTASALERDRTSKPWAFWMLRYIATDDTEAMNDLIWSVGGSPPYGGVSYEEAEAVYELIEDFRGPGEASDERYRRVESYIKNDAERQQALAAFRCCDEITSSPGSFTCKPVDRGLTLARETGHRGVEAAFLCYQSDYQLRKGDLKGARDSTKEALDRYLALVDADPAYANRIRQNSQNLISFTAMAGDVPGALKLLQGLGELLPPEDADQLRQALQARL